MPKSPAKAPESVTGCGILVFSMMLLGCLFGGLPPKPTAVSASGLLLAIIAALIARYRRRNRHRSLEMAHIDTMTGMEFELYLEKLLSARGFQVELTQATGDLGVDLIATREEDIVAIQVKRSSSNVSRRAVSDAVAGMHHYQCTEAMVITNSYFTSGAIQLADSTGCILVDRDMLSSWIVEYQGR